jgi:hypothetical protein
MGRSLEKMFFHLTPKGEQEIRNIVPKNTLKGDCQDRCTLAIFEKEIDKEKKKEGRASWKRKKRAG